ncbi:nucleotidyl transferase AbiEii/AbiGii toxin family protein [Nitratiruptor sp. SB155-2]|uniref:nucleotidyl transferase AbiEii/AbiGii toxin family protein n=1 Tax=Nitratiruptor sp. (strain SB155-2) TaxID=387092 RepID=UPI0001587340|nr:nucleotidyl transferase AbiEii/AbiGii toxin family protein [Nitratiruptor sp. SB155-2]BAF69860.1 hypothetical protein NIS_0748 [Nitratiruptor sp. SB155-2]
MTSQVKKILDIFAKKEFLKENDLYFIGGTALSYYLNHRISEDIDFISSVPLNHRLIKKEMLSLNAKFIEDENASRLRIAGDIAQNIHSTIIDKENLFNFVKNMSEPIDDETVYLKENSNKYLLFEDLKETLIKTIKGLCKGK